VLRPRQYSPQIGIVACRSPAGGAALRIKENAALNRAFKTWPQIFHNDSTLTSALLDRLLHHAETVVIEGRSYRMREQTED